MQSNTIETQGRPSSSKPNWPAPPKIAKWGHPPKLSLTQEEIVERSRLRGTHPIGAKAKCIRTPNVERRSIRKVSSTIWNRLA